MSPEIYVPILLICGIYVAGEILAKLCKDKVDSLLFFMLLLVVCGSVLGFVSEEDFDSSLFSTITYGFGLPFAIISFGATVSLKELKGQIKTFIIGTAAVVTIIIAGLAIGTPFMGLRTALYSAVEIAGGGQAGLIFLTKAQEIGDYNLLALMLLLMNLQICVGYPLCVFALRKGIRQHLAVGDMMAICDANTNSNSNVDSEKKSTSGLIRIPEFMHNSFYYVFFMFALIALCAFYIGKITTISHYVWEIILGFIAVQLGLVKRDSIHRIGAGGLIFGMMYATVCSAMCAMEWTDLFALLPKVLLVFVVGIAGCALCGIIFSRIMKKNFWETFAVAMGCMVGFPPSLRAAESAVLPLRSSENLDEQKASSIIAYYQPQIVISGVVTISIETGILAGILVSLI